MVCRTPLASPLILWRGSCFSLTGLPSSEFSLISLHIEFILPSFPPIIWRRRTILPDSILRRMTGSPSPQIPDTSRILVTYYLIQGNNGILDKDNFSHSFKRVVQAGTPLLLKMFHLSPPMYSWLLPTRHACMPLCLTSQRSHPLGLLWGCTSLLYSVKYITVW